MTQGMHPDQIEIGPGVVRGLLRAQLPRWAGLHLEPVVSPGTSNALYRLGDDMVVRLPLVEWATEQVQKEQRWLPRLASSLPLAIPVPLALGIPGEGYPWHWSVYRWIEGENALDATVADTGEAATALAGFVQALHRIDLTDAPRPGSHNFFRGVPLAVRDAPTREALAALDRAIDTDAATAAWEVALRAPEWDSAPVLFHGDLIPSNLLVHRGRLTGVVDFGGLGAGDPACDLLACWSFLPAEGRETFRAALGVDDATWVRGRGWALSVGLIALPYYRSTSPAFAALAAHMIDEVLADHEAGHSAP